MISIIITSFKEPERIIQAIKAIADPQNNNLPDKYEIIQISPDKETLANGLKTADALGISKHFIQLVDQQKGKPTALNMGFKKARGEIIVLTDGDVEILPNSIPELLKPFADQEIGAVTGRPTPENPRTTYWGYLAHVFTSAADSKRKKSFPVVKDGYYKAIDKFFPLSGYIFAIRNINLKLPTDLALDDLYISYSVYKAGYKLAYAPLAQAKVKFPTNLTDYIKQRRRNLAGHIDIGKHKELAGYKNERSFVDELEFIFFPLTQVRDLKEFCWALSMYPLRLYTWFKVAQNRLGKQSIMGKGGWERVESAR